MQNLFDYSIIPNDFDFDDFLHEEYSKDELQLSSQSHSSGTIQRNKTAIKSSSSKKLVGKLSKENTRMRKFPRILKKDFRRYLPQIYANVLNGFSLDQLMNFFRTFCIRNCDFVTEFVKKTEQAIYLDDAATMRFIGAEYIIVDLAKKCFSIPDMMLEMKSAMIKQSDSYRGCKIESSMIVRGTVVYRLPETRSNSDLDINLIKAESSEDFLPLVVPHSADLLPSPYIFDVSMKLIMDLDEENRIYRIRSVIEQQ